MTPRARTVCGLVAGVGMLAVLVLLLKPVHASFEDDPILRLQAFDRPVGQLPTEVDCGAALSAVRSSSDPATLYSIARDEACHDEAYRRLIASVAAGAVVVVLSLLLVIGARMPDSMSAPGRTRRRYEPTRATWAGSGGAASTPSQPGEDEDADDEDAEDEADADAGEADAVEDEADAPALSPAEEGR